MSRRVLAIDPGTSCGWAVWQDGVFLAAGVWDLRSRRFEGGGMRYLRFETLFAEAVTGADLVAFEEVRMHMGTDAAHVYGGIVAILAKVCEARKIPYQAIPWGEVKKRATGKGNAKKDAMIAAANRAWGLELTLDQDDEADARWIAVTAAERYLPGGVS